MNSSLLTDRVTSNEKSPNKGKGSTHELKDKLKRQIEQLKSMILQIEWSLDMLRFGKTKCVLGPSIGSGTRTDEIPDVNMLLESQLYRYSGFYCVKFSKQEYVFNFSSLNKYDKKSTFAVQVLNDQDQGKLGKWVMPMGIDLNDIISEIPINQLKNIPRFLRTCKHYIDTYFIRQEQYITLVDTVSHIKNCNMQADVGYTQITFNVMGVYNENTDSHMNVIIYLLYNINEARPYKIEVDSTTEDGFDRETKKLLQTSLVCFKKFELAVAFEKMLNDKPFIWTKEDDEDSPLEINTLSDSEDGGFLEEYSLERQKSLTLQRSRSQMKKRRKKSRKEKIISLPSTSMHNESSISVRNKRQTTVNLNQSSARRQNIPVTDSTPNINDPKQKKLRQTKLQFQNSDSELQNSSNIACPEAPVARSTKLGQRTPRPFTSTPLRGKKQNPSNLVASSDIDISDVTVTNSSNRGKSKINIDTPKKKNLRENNAPVNLLQKKIKKKIKSVESKQ